MPRTQPLRSRLANDQDLQGIIQLYVEEMPGRIANLLDCLERNDWEGIQHQAHQMKGSAGSHGFDPVSLAAGKVEAAVREHEPEDEARKAVVELLDLCRRVRSE